VTEPARKRLRLTRDAVIVAFALAAASFEITLGGARPAVLTFLTGLLLTPVVMRVDDARKGP
jgi:hypothetical protein